MKKIDSKKNVIRRIFEGRAARVIVVAVTAFLCALTILEFLALRFEWELPILEVLSGDNGFWSEEYQWVELALDDSSENELLEPVGIGGENSPESKDMVMTEENADTEGSTGTDGMADVGNVADTERVTDTEDVPDTEDNRSGTVREEEAEFPYYIRINRKQNCITIYTLDEQGEYTVPYKAMVCSTGLYNATPRGTYKISTKYRWRELYGNVYGQYATRIHGGVLFHSVPYYRKSENALCTEKYNKLGQQASMGCVRLTVEDAKWIAENCPAGTMVEIYDDDNPGPLGKPEAVKIDTDSPNKGWDPTDPSENNPWKELSEDE